MVPESRDDGTSNYWNLVSVLHIAAVPISSRRCTSKISNNHNLRIKTGRRDTVIWHASGNFQDRVQCRNQIRKGRDGRLQYRKKEFCTVPARLLHHGRQERRVKVRQSGSALTSYSLNSPQRRFACSSNSWRTKSAVFVQC